MSFRKLLGATTGAVLATLATAQNNTDTNPQNNHTRNTIVVISLSALLVGISVAALCTAMGWWERRQAKARADMASLKKDMQEVVVEPLPEEVAEEAKSEEQFSPDAPLSLATDSESDLPIELVEEPHSPRP